MLNGCLKQGSANNLTADVPIILVQELLHGKQRQIIAWFNFLLRLVVQTGQSFKQTSQRHNVLLRSSISDSNTKTHLFTFNRRIHC